MSGAQTLYLEVNKASEALRKAGEQNEEMNKEQRLILGNYFEKIGFYSAASIPLSITIVSLVLDKYSVALAYKSFLGVPNICWVFASWISFGIAIEQFL